MSSKLCLPLIGCSLFLVSILNVVVVCRHISLATVSLSNQNEDYTFSITLKTGDSNSNKIDDSKILGEDLSSLEVSAGNSNLRSSHRVDAKKEDKSDGEEKFGKKNEKTEAKGNNNIAVTIKADDSGIENIAATRKAGESGTSIQSINKNGGKDKGKPITKDGIETKEIVKTINDVRVDEIVKRKNSTDIINSKNSTFVRHDNVVIATKIHGAHQWSLLVQSMCLLHYAYNNKVSYDIVVFATEPVPEEEIKSLQKMISPTKFRLVVDNKGLQNEIASLTPAKHEAFLKMCNVSDTRNLTWFSKCSGNRLAYNWQAEFRAVHLWNHPSISQYKTMVWLDTDGFATKPWENDPVDYFIKNDGVIMFDHFPQAKSKYWVQKRVYKGFNATICKLELSKETGNLEPKLGTEDRCQERGIPNIHGFFHITNLDFYRSPVVSYGLATILDNCFLCREPDDQLAVTAPAAILAPQRSWEMRSKGFHLDVFHNFMLDGIDQAKPAGFIKYWEQKGRHTHPAAAAVCKVTDGG